MESHQHHLASSVQSESQPRGRKALLMLFTRYISHTRHSRLDIHPTFGCNHLDCRLDGFDLMRPFLKQPVRCRLFPDVPVGIGDMRGLSSRFRRTSTVSLVLSRRRSMKSAVCHMEANPLCEKRRFWIYSSPLPMSFIASAT
jgi:hypothetical protein